MKVVRSKISSPFCLEKPVSPRDFKGRQTILKNISNKISNAYSGHPEQILLCGQRGMGKTSLIQYLKEEYSNKKLLVLNIIDPISVNDFMIQIIEEFINNTSKEPHHEKIINLFKDNLIISDDEKKVFNLVNQELVSQNNEKYQFIPSLNDLNNLKENFLDILSKLIDYLRIYKGLIITVDEINYLSQNKEFITWYNQLSFNLKEFNDLSLVMIFTLKPDNLRDLYLINPNFKQIFTVYALNQLSNNEVEDFYKHMFSKMRIKLDDKAIERMVICSAGMPFMMEEIGDAVYWNSNGIMITEQDATNGIIDAGKITFSYQIPEEIPQFSK